jgi:hypothetical protein
MHALLTTICIFFVPSWCHYSKRNFHLDNLVVCVSVWSCWLNRASVHLLLLYPDWALAGCVDRVPLLTQNNSNFRQRVI